MSVADELTAVGTIGAALAAAWAAWEAAKSVTLANRQRADDLERSRHADVRAFIEADGGDLALVIENRGPATAETVTYVSSAVLEANSTNVTFGAMPDIDSILPFERRLVHLELLELGDAPGNLHVSLTWRDQVGEHEHEFSLSVPPASAALATFRRDLDETRRLIYMLRPQLGHPRRAVDINLAASVFNALLHHSALIDNNQREVLITWAALGFPGDQSFVELRRILAVMVRRITDDLDDGPAPDFGDEILG